MNELSIEEVMGWDLSPNNDGWIKWDADRLHAEWKPYADTSDIEAFLNRRLGHPGWGMERDGGGATICYDNGGAWLATAPTIREALERLAREIA